MTVWPSIDVADLDLAQLGLVVLIDDIGIEAVGAVLDGLVGNDDGILQGGDQQPRRDRLPGPQRLSLLSKTALRRIVPLVVST